MFGARFVTPDMEMGKELPQKHPPHCELSCAAVYVCSVLHAVLRALVACYAGMLRALRSVRG